MRHSHYTDSSGRRSYRIVFLLLSVALHGLIIRSWPTSPEPPQKLGPELAVRLVTETTPTISIAPESFAANPALIQPPAPRSPAKPPSSNPSIKTPAASITPAPSGLLEHSLESAREHVVNQEALPAPACMPGSEMTVKCAPQPTYADSLHARHAYDGRMPNLVEAAAKEEEARIARCKAENGGLFSLACLFTLPHIIGKAAQKLGGGE